MGWTFYNSSGQQLKSTALPTGATQAEMEAASSTAVFATPGRTQYHPGVAKLWCNWEQTGTHSILESYNVASITDGSATGETDHTIATDFQTTDYAVVGGGQQNYSVYTGGGGAAKSETVISTITLLTTTAAGADRDENYMAIFGNQ
jgi:hypothetical protein